jgi:glycosyltransferase involved in cell wall biosynthesis
MKVVAVDAVHLRPGGKGTARVLANLAPRLLAREEGRIRYMAFTTRAGAEVLGKRYARGAVVVVPEMLDSLWVHRALPKYARRAGADLLYLHREVGPLWGPPYLLHVPEDPTARWARTPPGAWRVRARAVLDRATMGASIRRARALATSTEATARDLARRFTVSQGRFATVPLGVDSFFFEAEARRAPDRRRDIFHLGSEDPRDSTLAVIRAYLWLQGHASRLPPPIVIAGDLGKLGVRAVALSREAAPGSVRILGRVSDQDLYALYSEALVCIQPSSDEGFGLQPLEAMSAGAPVIALDTPATREVLGEAAHLVQNALPEVLGRATDHLLAQPARREELERRGRERSKTFTWDKTADLVHGLVEQALVSGAQESSLAGRSTVDAIPSSSPPDGGPPVQVKPAHRKGAVTDAIRVMLLTSIIAPYRIPVFNALATRDDIELRVVYLAETAPHRAWPVYRDEIRHDYAVMREVVVVPAGSSYLHVSRGLPREVASWRPHVVVAGGWDQPPLLFAYLLRRRWGYAFAWWVESTERDVRGLIRLPTALKRLLVRGADSVVVPGSASSRYVFSLGAPPEKVVIAPNAVDTRFFASRGLDESSTPEGCRFLYVGRLHRVKGLDVLLDAWGLLDDRMAVLTVVGDGPARRDLQRRVGRARASSVRMLGHLDREALAAEYALADVFVFPSRSDPWGLVLNEAMASGLPVISTSAPGAVDDLVTDGWNGFVVRPGDARALSEAMRALAADWGLRNSMGRRSADRIGAFTPERCAEGLAEAARKAVAARMGLRG